MAGRIKIIVVSGPICSGKTELVESLKAEHQVEVIKTKDLIISRSNLKKKTRLTLQRAGDKLDRDTKGKWIADALNEAIEKLQDEGLKSNLVVIDAVRKSFQVSAIRKAYGADVHHIHLTASPVELEERFTKRSRKLDIDVDYQRIKRTKTERQVESLSKVADVVVKTDRCSSDSVLVRATALLDLYPRSNQALVDVLVGGQYGSEGKGNIVGHIAPEYSVLVRVGGPNAGHQVYAEPAPEKYFHLPSGTNRAPHAKLILGAGAVIYPDKLMAEIAQHHVSVERLLIDAQAVIISDKDRKIEAENYGNISSTAQGVGVASAKKMTGRSDYKDGTDLFLAKDCEVLKPFIGSARKALSKAMAAGERILLEGTQGTSLSLHHGPYPHVTSRDTTVAGCLADAGIAPSHVRKVIMVCRTYPIRVGGPSGHMDYELKMEDIAERSKIDLTELKKTETTTTTKKARRIAEFDWAQLRDSVQLNGPTDIALTFVDYFSKGNRDAYRFEQLTDETISFVEEVERVSGRPVTLLSTDFNWRNVIDRRAW